MKRNFVILLFCSLCPIYAFGDFVPGRVRLNATASVRARSATGIYQSVRRAEVAQFVTDGKGATSFDLRLDNGLKLSLPIVKIQGASCGKAYLAGQRSPRAETSLKVDENSPARCRRDGPDAWRLLLNTQEAGERTSSQLVLEGLPDFLFLSQ